MPGIGIVTKIDVGYEEVIYYQYFPLNRPVDWSTLNENTKELEKHTINFSLKGNWLRKIESDSFKKAISGHQIEWP